MPVFGSGDGDGVHFFLLENLAKVLFRDGGLAHLLLRAFRELSQNVAVHIADMRDAGRAPVCLERREMRVGAPIQADHREVEALVGAQDLAITLCRAAYGQSGRAHCQCVDKFTSCNHDSPRSGQPWPLGINGQDSSWPREDARAKRERDLACR